MVVSRTTTNSSDSSSGSCQSIRSVDTNAPNILAYVKSNRSISLQPRSVLDDNDCIWSGDIARSPLKSQQQISVPRRGSISSSSSTDSESSSEDFDHPVVVFNRIAPNMRWRRLSGNVEKIVVFERPIR
ncbi:hypothetical protein AC579_5981 [Pseudocercospora musae]|uniref:Uncharacterized protein n=1 Tax=Pseudocercospora musae TaxID=113226 RepID=A0A139HZV9_9PEZI|nr:hypothetical protein AC579_5981 [Pseudocercospora musae]